MLDLELHLEFVNGVKYLHLNSEHITSLVEAQIEGTKYRKITTLTGQFYAVRDDLDPLLLMINQHKDN